MWLYSSSPTHEYPEWTQVPFFLSLTDVTSLIADLQRDENEEGEMEVLPSQQHVTFSIAQGTKGRQCLRQGAALLLAPLSKGVSRAVQETRVLGYSLVEVTKYFEVITVEHVNEKRQ